MFVKQATICLSHTTVCSPPLPLLWLLQDPKETQYGSKYLLSLLQFLDVVTRHASPAAKEKAAVFRQLLKRFYAHLPLAMVWRNLLLVHAAPSLAPDALLTTPLPQDGSFFSSNPAVAMTMWADLLADEVRVGLLPHSAHKANAYSTAKMLLFLHVTAFGSNLHGRSHTCLQAPAQRCFSPALVETGVGSAACCEC